jgi:glucuronate isomerase
MSRANSRVEGLAAASNRAILKFSDFLEALQQRHDYFHANGGRISDHGLSRCPADWCTESEGAVIFDTARAGTPATPEDQIRFAFFLIVFFGRLDAEKGWTTTAPWRAPQCRHRVRAHIGTRHGL